MDASNTNTNTATGAIYSRLADIMAETKAIGKTETNQAQRFKFRGIDNVMNELHALFAQHRVFILPMVEHVDTDVRASKAGGSMTFTRATIRFRYMTDDGSFVDTVNVGEAMDSGDKGMNKAMSIALKYSLLQMLLIPTDEPKDPDAQSPETDYSNTLAMALQEVNAAQTIDSVKQIWFNYAILHKDNNFIKATQAAKTRITNS